MRYNMGMSKTEVLVYKIKSTDPESDRSTILSSEYCSQQYPKLSPGIEQSIHSASADITQSLVWSQRHLVELEKLAAFRDEDLNKAATYFPPYPILDAVETINNKMERNVTKNPHAQETRIAFKKGVETATAVLELEELKTSEILRKTHLSLPTLKNIDKQIISLSGYYSAWEALRAKKTTANEFRYNPFSVILNLFKDGARNIDLKTVTPTTPIEAYVFTRTGNTVKMVKWVQDKDPIHADRHVVNNKEE